MTYRKSFGAQEAMHGSICILGIKLFMILFLSDLLYVLIDIVLLNSFESDFYHHLNLLLLLFHIIKSLAQIILIFMVVFRWLYHKYYIDCEKKKLFELSGFFHTQEKMFDLKNIREVKIQQGVLGKLFHYGDIILNVTASGGYEEKIRISKIQNPRKNVEFFENCI